MIGEQREQRDTKHERNEEEEEYVELAERWHLICPELEKVRKRGDRTEQAHEKRVGQKEYEELVVRERDAVVHPG